MSMQDMLAAVSKGSALVQRIAPLGEIKMEALQPDDIVRLGKAFEITLSPQVATAIAENAPKFIKEKDATLLDFVVSGALLRMVAGVKPVKRGDFIQRCGHCGHLVIPPEDFS